MELVFRLQPSARQRLLRHLIAGWVLCCLGLTPSRGLAQNLLSSTSAAPLPVYREDRILIQPKAGVSPNALAGFHTSRNSEVLRSFEAMGGLQVLSLPKGETVPNAIAQYEQSGLVQFAEPDYLRQLAITPNDPGYTNNSLWGLQKIDAPTGWDVMTSASNVVVAVLDSGVRYTHEDLASNMWVNPEDNGHGWNAITWTNEVSDDARDGHGTQMSGVIGAVGNNGKGVTGVAWRVQLMACKCFNSNGLGGDSDIIACLYYAMFHGARIINASFSSPGSSQSVSNAIATAARAGIIVVAAAGNAYPRINIDTQPYYPACYPLDNLVSVAYTAADDSLGILSNYGATNVDLAAPGEQIYSTYNGSDASYYGFYSGTSFATAYVSGTLALMLATYPTENYQQIISRLLKAIDPVPALAGKCLTGGRLNLRKALSLPIRLTALPSGSGPLQFRLSGAPNRSCVIQVSSNLASWTPLLTNTTSAAGTFDFTDSQAPQSGPRLFRAVSSF